MGAKFKEPAAIRLSWLLLASATVCCLLPSGSQEVSLQAARVKQQTSNSETKRNYQQQQQQVNSKSGYNRLFSGYQAVARASLPSSEGGDYVCAPFCSCSQVLVMDPIVGAPSRLPATDRPTNLSRVFCESSQFTDLLTIDRRAQIIHISLPQSSSADNQPQAAAANRVVETNNSIPGQLFRMPRLAQFTRLREIIIIKLKFEVCDSEVFKRGQQLLRLRLNQNHLVRITRSCLRNLDKLLELNLDHNHLSELESALFSGLTSLRSLSIAHNRLSNLAAHQFVNLSRLSMLNLVGNSFKTINLHLLEPMERSLRILLLSKNQIKSFIYSPLLQISRLSNNSNSTTATNQLIRVSQQLNLVGLVFRSLIKLNVDENKFERIKLLQLHRFYNIKYLSIRQNEIATIRDKAFNGLKLVELNLAHNQLQSISKCAFCNSTIKRLVLSNNNISLAQPTVLQLEPSRALALGPLQSDLSSSGVANETAGAPNQEPSASPLLADDSMVPPATSSQNMLILSQSIFGPLFGQLEYLDMSNNQQLANQLEFLLEPLLKLEYLNLASVGLDRSLPSPSLFKNLHQLRYLNLSHNQLDQLVAETIEPLNQLEVLDLSHNKFNELDESLLVLIDEMGPLKLVNFGSNPWYCSQCKVAPLYDWILRSPIYNLTCILPASKLAQDESADELVSVASSNPSSNEDGELDADSKQQSNMKARTFIVPLANNYALQDDKVEDVDLMMNGEQQQLLANSNYKLLPLEATGEAAPVGESSTWNHLNMAQDDQSIGETLALVASIGGQLDDSRTNFEARDYCLRCEFPSELSAFHIHDLVPGDFKFCAGAAPRFAASEPKIGLTLAIVIIGALFCIIIVVIVMYRKKSNTYYTNEDMDQLEGSSSRQTNGKRPVFSISSENENNPYGDGTDYSSPPLSRSTADSYSQEDDDDDDEDLDEAEDEDLDEEGDEEEEDDDEEEDEDEEFDGGDEQEVGPANKDDGRARNGGGNGLAGSQRPSGGSVDSQQHSRQSVEESKRQRRNQIDDYNRRNDQSAQKVPAAAPVAVPESQGQASSTSLASNGRQATTKSTASRRQTQQSSVDSGGTGNKQLAPDERKSSTSILVRNQSHPQPHKLAFAEQSSIELISSASRVAKKGRSREGGSPSSAGAEAAPSKPPSESLAASNRTRPPEMAPDERTPTVYQIPLSAGERRQQSGERLQHSLDRSAASNHRRRDKQSGPSVERSQTLTRRHQTSRQTSVLDASRLREAPSQRQSSGPHAQPRPKRQPTGGDGDGAEPLLLAPLQHNKPERARQRFAISKETSQTVGAVSSATVKQPCWTSGESHSGSALRPRAGPNARTAVAAANDNGSTASDDATTADSSALEQANACTDEPESMGFSGQEAEGEGGGALAMGLESDASSLGGPADDQRGPNAGDHNNRLRAAVSSHSALTQTGSDDLLD